MNAIHAPSRHDSLTVPTGLDSPRSKLVYLYLQASNGGSIDDLQRSLGLQKIALYPILNSLERQNHVTRDGETFSPT